MIQKTSVSRKIFVSFNAMFMLFTAFISVVPFVHIFFASVSIPSELRKFEGILLWPIGFNLESYKIIFSKAVILNGYKNTIFITVVGTLISLALSSLGAYVLSKRNVYWNKLFMRIVTIPMFISGGLIPFYLLVNAVGLNGKIWAVMIPYAINPWNMLIMRASFRQIPESIEESTKIDGASDFKILLKITLPLSLPVIAVMILFYAVGYWNSWFPASIFIRDRALYPLQLLMREIVIMGDVLRLGTLAEMTELGAENYIELMKYSTIITATLPILCLYPFLQKYFIKGIMVGSLKE